MDECVMKCEKHGEYSAAKFCTPWGAQFYTKCPKCEQEEERREIEKEEREERAKKLEAMKKANIEPEFFEATLSNFTPETESQREALNAALDIAEGRRTKVLLTGGNGVGKTHLACALAKELGGAVWTMYEISARIRETYTARARETELEVVRELASIPFLAIDEIGRTKGGEAELNWLSHIIDKRHARGLPTLLLSNRKLARSLPKEERGKAFEAFVDSDVISRFREGALIEIDAPDMRAR